MDFMFHAAILAITVMSSYDIVCQNCRKVRPLEVRSPIDGEAIERWWSDANSMVALEIGDGYRRAVIRHDG